MSVAYSIRPVVDGLQSARRAPRDRSGDRQPRARPDRACGHTGQRPTATSVARCSARGRMGL